MNKIKVHPITLDNILIGHTQQPDIAYEIRKIFPDLFVWPDQVIRDIHEDSVVLFDNTLELNNFILNQLHGEKVISLLLEIKKLHEEKYAGEE